MKIKLSNFSINIWLVLRFWHYIYRKLILIFLFIYEKANINLKKMKKIKIKCQKKRERKINWTFFFIQRETVFFVN